MRLQFESNQEHWLQAIIRAVRQLMAPPETPPKRPIGFRVEDQHAEYKTRKRTS